MKETVLSAKTSGTATKRFEVIVEVIKKNPPPKIVFVFFTQCFFYFLGTCSVFAERVTHIYIYIYISRKISIEHPSVGLASLAKSLYMTSFATPVYYKV